MTHCCSLGIVAALWAAPPTWTPVPDRSLADLHYAVQACQRLQQDEALAPLNIGVRVRNRVAVLWGPVPSVALALRAEAKLRAMIEFADVRNELIVMPDDWRDLPTPHVPPPLFR